MSQKYFCTIYNWTGEIPPDAVQLTIAHGGRPVVYRWGGEVHAVKKMKLKEQCNVVTH